MIFSRKRGLTASGRFEFAPEPDERPEIPVPDFGPYDIEVAPDSEVPRLDLGALHVPSIPGVALQLEAAPNGQIVRVQLEHEGSRLQLGAFAAPRTEGIWDELRAELRQALLNNGAKVVEVEGPYGPQLAARMTGGGQGAGVMEVRHIGIDGPRWFVHAVMIGPAAVDPEQAGPLHEVLRGLVVDRGSEARPVKEALPLRLPPEYAEQLAQAQAARSAQPASAAQEAEMAPASPTTPAPQAAPNVQATPSEAAQKAPAAKAAPAATAANAAPAAKAANAAPTAEPAQGAPTLPTGPAVQAPKATRKAASRPTTRRRGR
jgi:hypothetical protein